MNPKNEMVYIQRGQMDDQILLIDKDHCYSTDKIFDSHSYKLCYFINTNLIYVIKHFDTLEEIDKYVFYILNKIVGDFEISTNKTSVFTHPTKYVVLHSNASNNLRYNPHLIFWITRNYCVRISSNQFPLVETLKVCPLLLSLFKTSSDCSKWSRTKLKRKFKDLNIFEFEQRKHFQKKSLLLKKVLHFYYFKELDKYRELYSTKLKSN